MFTWLKKPVEKVATIAERNEDTILSQAIRQDENLQATVGGSGRLKRVETGVESDSGSLLESCYSPIANELAQVEEVLRQEIRGDTPWVARLFEHNWVRYGKRVRPAMLLLSGGAIGELIDKHHFAAAAIEMIHAATLVHDDVIDNASVRRHMPTVNQTWGSRASVLLGDFLFTHAFHVASRTDECSVIAAIARSSNKVCEGEIRQNANEGNFELTEAEYLDMIRNKTGELCSCSCRVGALLSGASEAVCNQFGEFGIQIGIAFQIIDDVLDVVGQHSKVGKTLGTDLLNQKPTLPVIHCLHHADRSTREQLLDLLRSPDSAVPIAPILETSGSIQYARDVAHDQLKQAVRFAKSLPKTACSHALEELAQFVLKRVN